MNLLEFARHLPEEFSEAEFINALREVINLDEIRHLSDAECQSLFDAVTFLADYLILLREFYRQAKTRGGHPVLDYRGPMIWNQLTRVPGEKPDFSQLTSFGVGEDPA
ncbi:hypothetical protein [Paracoccus methylarcula]|uniref:Uncharacterized protein n=1 Tax=Paracoccus methylarcula TaxID=72022 RepID=A0A3R7Q4E8_9RHOB|nr:hypothetical protein [Paracoccus methylarcula]RNF36061.1 hypothetical protein A7A09_001250 [Paracoccus methylarcula]